jgi:hypothetical protein
MVMCRGQVSTMLGSDTCVSRSHLVLGPRHFSVHKPWHEGPTSKRSVMQTKEIPLASLRASTVFQRPALAMQDTVEASPLRKPDVCAMQ